MLCRNAIPLATLIVLSIGTRDAGATPTLLAHGTLSGSFADLSGLSAPLDRGAPALTANAKNSFTGPPDTFTPAATPTPLDPNNARLDPESIRVSNDGKSVFISDEYGPYVYQFDRSTGQRLKSFKLPG